MIFCWFHSFGPACRVLVRPGSSHRASGPSCEARALPRIAGQQRRYPREKPGCLEVGRRRQTRRPPASSSLRTGRGRPPAAFDRISAPPSARRWSSGPSSRVSSGVRWSNARSRTLRRWCGHARRSAARPVLVKRARVVRPSRAPGRRSTRSNRAMVSMTRVIRLGDRFVRRASSDMDSWPSVASDRCISTVYSVELRPQARCRSSPRARAT